MANIEKVEIYFEPQGAYKRAFELGAEINMPFQQAVPKALQTADQILSMGGSLVAYGANKHFEVQVTNEKSDAEWAKFIASKCTSPNQIWKRWNGETSQGRWNVVVFLGKAESKSACFIATAVYSPNAYEVDVLRNFRDRFLMARSVGKKLITFYYIIGPSFAQVIYGKPSLRRLCRFGLRPIVRAAEWKLTRPNS